jgi:hypothetical protein
MTGLFIGGLIGARLTVRKEGPAAPFVAKPQHPSPKSAIVASEPYAVAFASRKV